MIIYSTIVANLTRRSFTAVQEHNYDEVLKGVISWQKEFWLLESPDISDSMSQLNFFARNMK